MEKILFVSVGTLVEVQLVMNFGGEERYDSKRANMEFGVGGTGGIVKKRVFLM